VNGGNPTDAYRHQRRDDKEGQQAFSQPDHGLDRRSPSRRLAGQKELPSTGVFLAAQQLGGKKEGPYRAEHRQDADGLPLGVTSDGIELMGWSDESVQPAARRERLGQRIALRRLDCPGFGGDCRALM
jgi:hypothetical protein